MKVLTIVGTRPEAVKLAPVVHALAVRAGLEPRVCVVGDDCAARDEVLALLGIEPDRRAARGDLDGVLAGERPDWVLVQGGGATAAAATLAAFAGRVRVAHLEAAVGTTGVANRLPRLVADLHLCPTEAVAERLRGDGVPPERTTVVGHVVAETIERVAALPLELAGSVLAREARFAGPLVLVATREREEELAALDRSRGLRMLAQRHPTVLFAVAGGRDGAAGLAGRYLGGLTNVSLLPALDYRSLVWLLRRAFALLTDDAGLHEEAAGIDLPVLVIAEADRHGLVADATRVVEAVAEPRAPRPAPRLGAAERVVEGLLAHALHAGGGRMAA
jgi:UDP-N-acetylglucosamine 2-epimerase (non-hydrolysing)